MQKLTPESFGATHVRRIENEIAGYTKPERFQLVMGAIHSLEEMATDIRVSMAPATKPTEGAEVAPTPDDGASLARGDVRAGTPGAAGQEATGSPDETDPA